MFVQFLMCMAIFLYRSKYDAAGVNLHSAEEVAVKMVRQVLCFILCD